MEKYLFDLDDVPKDYWPIFIEYNSLIKKAFKTPGKLIKISSGTYYVVIKNELINIKNRGWSAKEESWNSTWGEQYSTLRELQKKLGIL